MWWKILISAMCWGMVFAMSFLQIRDWRKKKQQRKEYLKWTDDFQLSQREIILEGRIRADMDILSKRITNAFEYVTTVMAAHKLEFHTKKGKKRNNHENY